MSFRRTAAVARKEIYHILRDPRTLFLVAVSPALLLLTLSYIFALDVERVDLALWDQDQSFLSRQYVSVLVADGDFRIRDRLDGYAEVDRLLQAGRVDGVLVRPPGFGAGLRGGRSVEIQAVMDGTDPIAANQAILGLTQRTTAFGARFQVRPSVVVGEPDLRSEVWYNPTLESLVSMVPGLAAVVLSMPALALALSLAREKETGSFEGLIGTPVQAPEYLLGKLGAYLASGTVSVFSVWLVAVLYFRVPFTGELSLYLLLAADYLLASMGYSLLISNFVRSQQTAMFLVLMIFFVPAFFVAGLIAPVDAGSLGSRLVAGVLPASHFITISRGVFLKGLGVEPLAGPALILGGMATGGLLVSLLLFRKRLD
jgi:ABC-type multidrug transport system permease subunit